MLFRTDFLQDEQAIKIKDSPRASCSRVLSATLEVERDTMEYLGTRETERMEKKLTRLALFLTTTSTMCTIARPFLLHDLFSLQQPTTNRLFSLVLSLTLNRVFAKSPARCFCAPDKFLRNFIYHELDVPGNEVF